MKAHQKTKWSLLVAVLIAALTATSCGNAVRPLPTARHDDTRWIVRESLVFEAIAFLNALSGDPKFGYNNWPDYAAEDSVRALEQLIQEDIGLGKRWTWREDGGMQALAVVLYELMKQEGFPQNGEGYQDFVIRMVKEGKLAPGKTEALYQQHAQ
jgi:hypothetical protein